MVPIAASLIFALVTASVASSVLPTELSRIFEAETASLARSLLPIAPPRTFVPVTASLPRSALPTPPSRICKPLTALATILAVLTLLRARSTLRTWPLRIFGLVIALALICFVPMRTTA